MGDFDALRRQHVRSHDRLHVEAAVRDENRARFRGVRNDGRVVQTQTRAKLVLERLGGDAAPRVSHIRRRRDGEMRSALDASLRGDRLVVARLLVVVEREHEHVVDADHVNFRIRVGNQRRRTTRHVGTRRAQGRRSSPRDSRVVAARAVHVSRPRAEHHEQSIVTERRDGVLNQPRRRERDDAVRRPRLSVVVGDEHARALLSSHVRLAVRVSVVQQGTFAPEREHPPSFCCAFVCGERDGFVRRDFGNASIRLERVHQVGFRPREFGKRERRRE